MSEQRKRSDFSIARILSNDLKPDKEVFDKKETENEICSREGDFEKRERLEDSGRNEDLNGSTVMGKERGKMGKERGKEFPWLRCTRYSPPKLPRRSGAGKLVKRKLGSHPRIPFTKTQIQVLEEKYRVSAYLSRRDVVQLAGDLNLPQNRVKIWFQNRRARERRESQSHNH